MPNQKRTNSRTKALYRVRNWSQSDKALAQQGSITFWMSDDFEKKWLYTGGVAKVVGLQSPLHELDNLENAAYKVVCC